MLSVVRIEMCQRRGRREMASSIAVVVRRPLLVTIVASFVWATAFFLEAQTPRAAPPPLPSIGTEISYTGKWLSSTCYPTDADWCRRLVVFRADANFLFGFFLDEDLNDRYVPSDGLDKYRGVSGVYAGTVAVPGSDTVSDLVRLVGNPRSSIDPGATTRELPRRMVLGGANVLLEWATQGEDRGRTEGFITEVLTCLVSKGFNVVLSTSTAGYLFERLAEPVVQARMSRPYEQSFERALLQYLQSLKPGQPYSVARANELYQSSKPGLDALRFYAPWGRPSLSGHVSFADSTIATTPSIRVVSQWSSTTYQQTGGMWTGGRANLLVLELDISVTAAEGSVFTEVIKPTHPDSGSSMDMIIGPVGDRLNVIVSRIVPQTTAPETGRGR
jgi:hypothetical protein